MNNHINLDKIVTRQDYVDAINLIMTHFFDSLDKEMMSLQKLLEDSVLEIKPAIPTSQQKAAEKLEESVNSYMIDKKPEFSEYLNSPQLVSINIKETGLYILGMKADIQLPNGNWKSSIDNIISKTEHYFVQYKI